MQSNPASPAELALLECDIHRWLTDAAADNPAIEAIERGESGERIWYVRVRGDDKDVWTVRFVLAERTLRFETYLMPSPEENREQFYEYILRRNRDLTGMALLVGDESAIFLAGSLPVASVSESEIDRILGSMWAYVERVFLPALKIGFARRFASRPVDDRE